jgi:hypothetical protein
MLERVALAISTFVLASCSTFQLTSNAISVTEFIQQNSNGSSIPWAGWASDTHVSIGAVVTVPGSDNACPTHTTLEVEVRPAADRYQFVATGPAFPPQPCTVHKGWCSVRFAPQNIANLAPSSAYKWQLRATTLRSKDICEDGKCRCEGDGGTATHSWEEYGIPKGFAFRTGPHWQPRSERAVAIPRRVAEIESGSIADTRRDDQRYLVLRSYTSPPSNVVAADFLMPIFQGIGYRAVAFTFKARSSRPCQLSLGLKNYTNGNSDPLGSFSIGTQDQVFSGLNPRRHALTELLDLYPGQLAPNEKGVMLSAACLPPGGGPVTLYVDHIEGRYEVEIPH